MKENISTLQEGIELSENIINVLNELNDNLNKNNPDLIINKDKNTNINDYYTQIKEDITLISEYLKKKKERNFNVSSEIVDGQ